MSKDITTIGKALKILIEKGELSRAEHPTLHESIINDGGQLEDLGSICRTMGLFLCENAGTFYVSSIPGDKTFGYTNEELRLGINSYFKNQDLYTVLFIIANIVTEFYPEASLSPTKPFIKKNDIMDIIDKKIEILRKDADLENISDKTSYNFEVVVKKWSEIPRVIFNKGEGDSYKRQGKESKIQLLNSALLLLKKNDLIKLVEINDDEAIYITERFKAIISKSYNEDEIQVEIYTIIDSLASEQRQPAE